MGFIGILESGMKKAILYMYIPYVSSENIFLKQTRDAIYFM
jgi:hypothetical protein